MEARAINRYITSSPRKMRLLVDMIRGRSVDEAISLLHFSPKHASFVLEKTIRSAVSNIQNKAEGGRIDSENLYVKTAYVNQGPSMKRIMPAPMGRAYRIIKRSNHLTVVVAEREEIKKQVIKPKKTKEATAIKETEKTVKKEVAKKVIGKKSKTNKTEKEK